MKRIRLSETWIVAILQQRASGQTVAQTVRGHGLGEATFYALCLEKQPPSNSSKRLTLC